MTKTNPATAKNPEPRKSFQFSGFSFQEKPAPLRFKILPGAYAVAKLTALPPGWPQAVRPREPALFSLTQTDEELSLVCPETTLPPANTLARVQRDWRALKIEGPLDFSLVGILARATQTLAQRRVPLFALSTYDTDYILVPAPNLASAIVALREDGNTVCE